jgi:hypothetical protein
MSNFDYSTFVGRVIWDCNTIDEIANYYNQYPKYANQFIWHWIAQKRVMDKKRWNTLKLERYLVAANRAKELNNA